MGMQAISGIITGKGLIDLYNRVRPENDNIRYNGAPSLREFVELAKKYPELLFEVKHLPGKRTIDVYAVLIPLPTGYYDYYGRSRKAVETVIDILKHADTLPNTLEYKVINGKEYCILTWD